MQTEELLNQTASEKLTLEQEYEMQQKWYQDKDSEILFSIVIVFMLIIIDQYKYLDFCHCHNQ